MCAIYTPEPGEVARRRAKIASASSRASWLVFRVRYQSRIPRLRANAELECTWELDWSRRGGPRCRRKPARPEYNISERARAHPPLGASGTRKSRVREGRKREKEGAEKDREREILPRHGVLFESYDEAAVHFTSPGLPVIPDGAALLIRP